MNKEETKILSYLSDNFGDGGNILEMSKGIDKRYWPAYYPNIYNTARKLAKIGVIDIEHEGNSKLVRLNTENPLSTYYISEIENYKNQKIAIPKEMLSSILNLSQKFDIFSICALDPERCLKINRLELLILIRNHDESSYLLENVLQMESTYNIKIDPIILTPDEFAKLMKGGEMDLIKDLILSKNILYNSDGFWELIKQRKIDTSYRKLGKYPQDLTSEELSYNYNRFGYRLNESAKTSNKLSIELTIFSMSINEEIRIKYGAIILLYKNISKINLAHLYYLYKRYDDLGIFKGILLSLAKLPDLQSNNEIRYYCNIISEEPSAFDGKMVKRYIGLYK